jgi:hypothetical protein
LSLEYLVPGDIAELHQLGSLQGWEVSCPTITLLARQAEWVAEQEALYARGVAPGLPSDTSIDESSELVEVSVQGPLGVTEDSVSVGDSEEWEDVW